MDFATHAVATWVFPLLEQLWVSQVTEFKAAFGPRATPKPLDSAVGRWKWRVIAIIVRSTMGIIVISSDSFEKSSDSLEKSSKYVPSGHHSALASPRREPVPAGADAAGDPRGRTTCRQLCEFVGHLVPLT